MTGKNGLQNSKRGRPTVLDPHEIATRTLKLWSEHGYSNVSWADISEATGISVRTLTRHFENKAAIAWVGTDEATRALDSALQSTDFSVELNEALTNAIEFSLHSSSELATTGRLWVEAVAQEPALIAAAARAHEPWIQVIADFLSQRMPDVPHDQCVAIAHALQVGTFQALLSEARAPQYGSPEKAVRALLTRIRIVP